MAGTGKSTIARTIARTYYEQERLGASFFFSRGGGDVSHAGKFFTSIAVQLADKSPPLKRHICEAIAAHSDIANQAFRDQWNQLILRPLSKLAADSFQSPLILVVDALDECEGENDIRKILQLFAEAPALKTVRLRIFITSRPEIPIRHGFYDISEAKYQGFILHNISPSVTEHDISIFLNSELEAIRREHTLPSDWPGEHIIQFFIRSAGGLFIFAATACRFLRDPRWLPEDRLPLILQGHTTEKSPTQQLDNIYAQVLKHSVVGDCDEQDKEMLSKRFRQIIGSIVILFDSLSATALSRLLNVRSRITDVTLSPLHSVLRVPDSLCSSIRLLHPSFRDFLLDKKRCRDQHFWVDEKKTHEALAENCVRLMFNCLRRDICGLCAPGALAREVGSSIIGQYLPPDLQYACCYWVQHLQRSEARLVDDCQVHKFLQKHFLHWLEALSLIGKTSNSIHMVTDLESIVRDENSRLRAIIHDAKRFILYNRWVIEEAPLQLYSAALVFAPKTSIVREQFLDQFPPWIYRLPEVQKAWSATVQTLEGHSDSVTAVAFSPNGQLLASASEDYSVRLWDVTTGASCGTLEGHSGSVNTVVFSPNGQLLASASADYSVRLWDATTGASRRTFKSLYLANAVIFSLDGQLLVSAFDDGLVRLWSVTTGALHSTLEVYSYSVTVVAFSPDGQLFASASEDKSVKLWNVTTGMSRDILKGYLGQVSALTFSPDGQLLASASKDYSVRLWDATTGAPCGTLGHSTYVVAVAFSPDGQLLASATTDMLIRLWDITTGAPRGTLGGHLNSVMAIVFSPDCQLLASASGDNSVRLWDVTTEASHGTLEDYSHSVTAVTFSPDGQLLASASEDKSIKLWNVTTGISRDILKGHSGQVSALAFSPDGQLLASASYNNLVRLWYATTGASRGILQGHSDYVVAVAFSPDGQLLASASYDKSVRLWNATTGESCSILSHSFPVKAVAFSLDGQLLASASFSSVRLWDVQTKETIQTFSTKEPTSYLSFSSDGSYLKTGCGLFKLSCLHRSVSQPQSDLSLYLYVKKQWVACGTKNVLWLPGDYRSKCFAVRDNILAMGHVSGKVTFIEFDLSQMPLGTAVV